MIDDSDPVTYDSVQDQFYRIYGEAMTAWTRLESAIFRWFEHSTGMPEALARAIFYAARNFTGRRDMLDAALPFAPLNPAEQAFIRAAIKKVRRYSEFRNKMAHREPILDARKDRGSYMQMILVEGSDIAADPDAITLRQLGTATQNFEELRRLLDAIYPPDRSQSASLASYLELVRSLPNDAYSDELPPSPKSKRPRRPKPQA